MTTCPRSTMLNAFAAALDADLAVSPMLVVGGTDDACPWNRDILDLAGASGIHRRAEFRADTQESVAALADWIRDRAPDESGLQCIVIGVQGLGEDHLLGAMLQDLRYYASDECLIALSIDPEQIAQVRRDIRSILGVEEALVPVTWQGVYPDVHEIGIVGSATLVGRQNGAFFIAASVSEPYPHEVHIEIDMGDRDENVALDDLAALGPDCDFAVLATVRDGSILARFDGIAKL